MYEAHDVVQRSLNWQTLRLGRLTSSLAKRMFGGIATQQRLVDELRYELDLRERMGRALPEPYGRVTATEVRLSGVFNEFREYVGKELNVPALKWGRTMEPRALAAAQLRHDAEFTFPGVLESSIEHEREGGMAAVPLITSPDAMWDGRPVEVKCPYNEDVHERVFVDGPWRDYGLQITMHALVAGAKEVLFVSFDPRTNEVPMLYTKIVSIPDADIDAMKRACIRIWSAVAYDDSLTTDNNGVIPKLF